VRDKAFLLTLLSTQELKAVVGVDLDPFALAIARPRLEALAHPDIALHFVHANYR
jgi:ribosomal protein L11 methylase PrmA